MEGPPTPSRDREAWAKFLKVKSANPQAMGTDHANGSGCFYDFPFRLPEKKFQAIVKEKGSIYVFGYAEYKNEAGADFHSEACFYMAPPSTLPVGNPPPAWRFCER